MMVADLFTLSPMAARALHFTLWRLAVLVVCLLGVVYDRAEAALPIFVPALVGEEPNGGGVFRFPQGIAVAPGGGRVFVGDQYSGIIQAFDRNGNFLFSFGGRAARREPGRLGIIGGVAADRSGHVYVLDSEFDRIQVFAAKDGRFLTSFGDESFLDLAAGIANGGGISSSGISVWQANKTSAPVLFIADQGHNRVTRIDLNRKTLRPARPPRFSSPWAAIDNPQGLGVNPAGTRVYVADDNHHRIAVLNARSLRLIGQFGSFGLGGGQFHDPFDVAVDGQNPGRIYVADNLNNRVDVFDESSWASVGTWGRFGRDIGEFSIVRAVAAPPDDSAGGVWVTDTANNRIQVLDAQGTVTSVWGIAGRSQGYFTRPRGVALDSAGGLAVADHFAHRVARFSPDGTYLSDFGKITDYHGYAYAGNEPGQLKLPTGITFDTAGIAWISDSGNRRVQGINPATGKVVYKSSPGVFEDPKAVSPGPDGSVLVADSDRGTIEQLAQDRSLKVLRSNLTNPSAIAFDGKQTIYAADDFSIINVLSGDPIAPPGKAKSWDYPSGLAIDQRDGTLYVAERRLATARGARVLRGTPSGGRFVWDEIAGEGVGWGKVIEPAGLALSPDGQTLFVADNGNNRVWRFHTAAAPPPTTHQLTTTVDPLVGGHITSEPGGINCPSDCTQRFGQGRQVILTAEAAAGKAFVRWTGACAEMSEPSCSLRVDGPVTVGVVFGDGPPVIEPPLPPPLPAVELSDLTLSTPLLYLARPAKGKRPALPESQATVSFYLTRPATVTATVEQPRPGISDGTNCRPLAAGEQTNCVRWARLPLWRNFRLLPGSNSFTTTATFMGRRLSPGRYRLSLEVIDWSGNRRGPFTRVIAVRRRAK